MKNALFVALGLLISAPVFCQQADPFEEMGRQMNEAFERMRQLQERMMQQGFGNAFTMPDGDSSFFYFHIDTTFSGDGDFHFSPFGNDGMGGSFFFGDPGDIFRDFFNGSPFEQPFTRPSEPADDGNTPPDDGLLPEERLRNRENAPKQESQPKKTPSKKPDPNVIRI